MTEKVMNLQQFTEAYKKQNPNDRVAVPKAVTTQWGILIAYFIGLIAANILSASHTGPMLASTFGKIDPALGAALGFFGVLAVEFTAFIMMLIPFSDNRRENILRVIVIGLAITVSIIANINATFISLQTNDTVGQIAAGIVGLFAPLANIGMAEVLRLYRERTKKDREAVELSYRDSLKQYDVKMRERYARYLKQYGITDATMIMQLSSGQDVDTSNLPQSNTELKSVIKPAKSVTNVAPRIARLAETLVSNGDAELSYKAIEQKYGVRAPDISKAKTHIREHLQ